MSAVQKTKRTISQIFLALSKTASLHPSPTVNRLFSRLVRICSTVPCRVAQIILAAPDITSITERLRHLCSCGESELERFWSQKICSSTKPLRVLEQFPYICNYREAARIEWQMACAVHKKTIKKCLFIGGGPLPLTAIVLASAYGVTVDVLDCDRHSVVLARQVIAALGLQQKIRIREADAFDFKRFSAYPCIFMAALVGERPSQKNRLLQSIARQVKHGAVVVVRSACGLKTLLYPPVESVSVGRLKLQFELHPFSEKIINSTLIFCAESV